VGSGLGRRLRPHARGVDLDPAPDGSATLVSRLRMSGDAFLMIGYGDVIPNSMMARGG
jgi:hypothetical protein